MSAHQSSQGWKLFLKLLKEPNMQAHLEEFFDLFFTSNEKMHLSARVLIIQELLENQLTQREIAEQFNVSISQITRGSNALKNTKHSFYEKLANHLRAP